MKKLLSVCLVLVMVMCFSVTAFAKGGFVSSPSENLAPEVIEPSNGSIVVHSYAERHELTEKQRKAMEDAYDSILNNSNLYNLNSKLGDIANNKNLDVSKFAVSDLFNVDYVGSGLAGTQTIKLKADTLSNFVSLMFFADGKWQLIDDAKIEDGLLVFNTAKLGPYAIVVNTASATSPQTGVSGETNTDNTDTIVYGALMLITAFCALVMWRKSRKYTA